MNRTPYPVPTEHLWPAAFSALVALGLISALLLSQRTAAKVGVSPQRLWDAGIFAVAAAYVISRGLLLAVHWRSFLAAPALLLAVPSLTAPGILLTVAATFLWLRLRGVDLRRALDAWAPCALLMWAFLSLGHLAEGSDPGMPSRWGVKLRWNAVPAHPVALYGCVAALLLAWWALRRLDGRHAAGQTAGLSLAAAGVAQYFVSFLRIPGNISAGLDVIQWAALGMVCSGAAMVFAGERNG